MLNSDTENLTKNMNISTIFLDDKLRIIKYTSSTEKYYPNLVDNQGQPVSNLSGIIPGDQLAMLSQKVLANDLTYHQNIQSIEGHLLAMTVTCCVGQHDPKGIFIHFTDIENFIDSEKQTTYKNQKLRLAANATKLIFWEHTNLNDLKFHLYQPIINVGTSTIKDTASTLISIKDFEQLIDADYLTLFRKTIKNALKRSELFEIELMLDVENSENYQWFHMSGQLHISKKNSRRLIGTLRNIHRRKLSESNLARLNAELEHFAYLASHDMKEPLKTIHSFSKLIKEEYEHVLGEDGIQYLDIIENASERMLELTSDLLDFSLLKHQNLKIEKIILSEVIREIENDYHILITENEATINITSDGELTADYVQFKQLLSSLVENAIKYRSDAAPIINISIKTFPQKYKVIVTDNGIGIAEEDQEQVFKVFKRLESMEPHATGIGLANCKRIVENHKGKIELTSSLGKGSEFKICFPKIQIEKNIVT